MSLRANRPVRTHKIQMKMSKELRGRWYMCLMVLFCVDLLLTSQALPQNNGEALSASAPKSLTLVQAVMCEGIKDYRPLNPAIVFSVNLERVSCFTSFDAVRQRTFIHQEWFHRERLNTKRKLFLQPPRWSTSSSIQLRETDKGPWRVEITDEQGQLLRVLRFSITD